MLLISSLVQLLGNKGQLQGIYLNFCYYIYKYKSQYINSKMHFIIHRGAQNILLFFNFSHLFIFKL